MAGAVSFRAVDSGRRVEVSRDSEVSDDFWRRLRAEWGQAGENPNSAVLVPSELFAARHDWLPEAGRLHDISVDLDAEVRELLVRRSHDAARLQEIIQGNGKPDSRSITQQLEGGRFVRDLMPFQERDASKLVAIDNGANFSVPGAGKTTVELAVYEAERLAGKVAQLLVVAPLSSFEAWLEEADVCLHPSPLVHRFTGAEIPDDTEILLVTYQRLLTAYDDIAAWISERPTLVALDEAHRVKKGREGEWGRACLDLAFLADRRDVLTGTPAPQHPADLVALFDYLWPGQALRIMPSDVLVARPEPLQVAGVTDRIDPLFVRTTKSELNLSPPVKKVIKVQLGGLHREIYQSLRHRFSVLAKTQRQRLELSSWASTVMYLLEAATNPALLPAGSSTDDPIEFRHPPLPIPPDSSLHDLIADFAQYETPEKFIQLAALIDELRSQNHKVLIWSNFIRNLSTIEKMLGRHQPALVHGGIPSEVTQPEATRKREQEVARFRDDPSCGVLLANPAAMGEGVSLHHECHHAIYLDRTFNAGQYLQSVDRIHRLGMRQDVETTIYFLVSEGTIDESVTDRIDLKASNMGLMLNDPSIATMSLPDDEDIGEPLDVGDTGDIEALFGHLRGDDSTE